MTTPQPKAIDDLSGWLGLRWETANRVLLTIRPELINPAGLLAGPRQVAAGRDGSTAWQPELAHD